MAEQLPYTELSLEDLPNEEWLPLPRLDDCFYISNLGRVKSVDRYIHTKKGVDVFYKGRVYKQQILKYPNATTNDPALELKVGFFYKGVSYSVHFAHSVYDLFVSPILPENQKFYVGLKDGNNLHACASNLVLISPHQKVHQMFHNNRCRPIYIFQKTNSQIKGASARCIPITQFNNNGEPLAHYSSIKAAVQKTGLDPVGIELAVKGEKMVRSGGFLWKYGKIETTICTEYAKNFSSRKKTRVQ